MNLIKTTFLENLLKTKNLQLVAVVLVLSYNVNGQTSSYSSNASGVLGDDNCSFGLETLWNWNWLSPSDPNIGARNSAFGRLAMNFNTYGNNNSAFGMRSLFYNTTGNDNSATGYRALYLNTTGSNNTANGSQALYSTTTGSNNVANGFNALYSNTTGFSNMANGEYALYSNTIGAYNTAGGGRAMYTNISSSRNSAYGYQALTYSRGSNSTAIGFRSLYLNTTGSDNAACGLGSLSTNTTGSYNTGMGNYADVSTGNLSNATSLGYLTVSNASNKVRIGNTSVTVIEGQVAFTNVSDGRFKTNIKEEDVKGLEFIKRLRPVVYNFDTKKFTEFLTKNMPEDIRKQHLDQDFTASTNVRQSGFIAQEVESAAKEVNYNFNGVHVPENENDNYSLAYGEFVVPLVKAVQEQQKMIEEQKKTNEEQKKMIEKLQEQINELQKGGSTTGIGNSLSVAGASMDQNVPNPFSTETVINFNLPNQVGNAYMTVYDLSGKQIKTLPINQRGASSITITSDQLEAGMYIYSIVVDGKILDSKRMVVTGK